ncbi:AAA family ATPase (macronuclear) [Tetrahymena thermophila SB210]|uniref:AAA family ATPase n=1 Tax=Tetrahymena thermophila (strain SB210) TaxID=312017 RepID=I7MMI4_TETTS|nr:AAA family ATPase [Tetrahymena thermophila SB210]EAS04919.2 AAA family ATPase [Tetrahymena thermophila SB210]|eukprot:XP_001025164.2 AAA family ATPase [Tetrahymena thermophila SB210]
MREKQFFIKYRYARHEEEVSIRLDDENYQWHLIDLSDHINEGEITILTFDMLVELLKNDNAKFQENNIKLKNDIYWITIGENNFGIDFTIDEEEQIETEIILLLEQQKGDLQVFQENEVIQNLFKSMEQINIKVDKIQQRQNDMLRFFQYDNEIYLKDIMEETLNNQIERQRDLVNNLVQTTLSTLNDYYNALAVQIQQVENKQNQPMHFTGMIPRSQSFSASQQFMEQSFQFKPQHNHLANSQQNFNINMQSSEPRHQFNSSLIQQSIDFDFKKQETKESLFSNEMNKQQSQHMKEFETEQTSQNQKQVINMFGNLIKDDETRNKANSNLSDQNLTSIVHIDSKKMQTSSIFNNNGLQSKSDSQKNQENSLMINNVQGSLTDIDNKEKPIFQIKIPSNPKDSKENEELGSSTVKAPILFSNIPQDDAPEIDFFKNIVKPVPNKVITISQPNSSEAQAKANDIDQLQNKKKISSGSNLSSNIPNKVLGQNSINSKNRPSHISPDPQQFQTSSNKPSHDAQGDSSSSISFMKNKIPNSTHLLPNKENKSIEGQVRKPVLRDYQRRNSKFRNSSDNSKLFQSQNSGGNSNPGLKGKTSNMTDMTIMYSEPIVKLQIQATQQTGAQQQYLPAGDPVDYEQEIQKLNEFLKETNKQIKLDIVVASLDNLEKAFNRNTQILHIMCHGDYSDKEQQYYLAFEDEESKLDAITSKRFSEFLKQKNCNVKLVFFNACHSEEVGKIFYEAGIPFVIAVQSDLKIEDKAALTFSSSFYMNIFSGRSVLESFESAKISLQAKQYEGCFTCCCAHSHDQNCLWFEEAMNNGFDKAHEQHLPQPKCKCPNSKKMIHEYTCEWANDFLKKYKDNYEDYYEEVIQNNEPLFVCCCHGSETPHDESLKFRLIKREDQEDQKIMSDLPEGNIIEKSNLDFNHPIFQDQSKIFGRNMEIFKIYKAFMNNTKIKFRFVALHGDLGTGKTAVAKKVARHLKERGQVVEIIFEDFERMKTKITKFEQKMRLGYHTKEVAYSHLKDKKVLFILDNCDDLIKNNRFKFETTINELAQNTTAKFLIISHEKFDLKLGQGQIPQITLGNLSDFYVKQLIEFYAGDTIREHSNNPQFNEQLSELIKIMPKSPKSIMEALQNISENMDISQILTSLKNNQINERQKDFTAFNLLMKDLRQTNQQAYDMLLLISLFPHGVSIEDLKFLEKKKKIPHDWVKLMECLTLYTNEIAANRTSELAQHEIPEISGLKRMQSKRLTIFQQLKQEEDNMEEDDFDNDQQHEEFYRYKKFKNGQYFWMSVSRKFDVVVFRIKKFVVEQLKQQEYRQDLFHKEILILEYLSIFSRKLLHNLKEKSHHQERIIEYCSLSHSGLYGVHYIPQHQLHKISQCQSMKSNKVQETGESDNEYYDTTPENLHSNARGFSEDKKISVVHRDSVNLEKKLSDKTEQKLFSSLTPIDVFKLHEGNFYSYLNVEDHRQIIAHINSKQCDEKQKQKMKKHIQDLCVNIPSIHKLLDELSTSEEQCVQAEQVIEELLKNHQNFQFLVAKSKLLFLKISLYIEKFSSDHMNNSIEDVIHRDEIESFYEEVDKKFTEFDKNEVFIELMDIEKQFVVFYLIFVSFKKNKENELSHTFEQILKIPKDPRFNGVKGKVNLILESLIPKLLLRIKELKKKEESIDEDKKDIKMGPDCLNILESKLILLNSLFELEFNTQFQLRFQELEQAIKVFESNGLNSLMIQATVVYCKKKLNGLKNSRDTQNLIKLKKDMIDPALNNSKIWKLTSLEADCKKILGEINDQLHHISSNVFQFMRAAPIIYQDKKTPYGHIIRLNQSFKRRITDVLSKLGKELNLKFEIQTIKHFKECLQRGSKFMCITCDDVEEDGIIVEEDQLPLMRKYKENEMEEYYKQHYEEFGQIEILMLCTPNGLKLKEMFFRIIDKVNDSIKKMQNNPDKKQTKSKSTDEYKDQVDRDSELRRRPTIIAFQFKSIKKYTRPHFGRRPTIMNPSYQEKENGDQSNTSKKNKKQGLSKNTKEQEFSNEIEEDEYEDFYLYYLREFAIQQFQFEFLTQLLSDRPDPNPQSHIRRAFNYAKQKMVEATITVCSEDIRDEQTFEQILGKGPDLFLSDDWMDAKYEFRKGQIIDITSERPPQNLNRNFLRISGRKQDIYIILQKIQESCVNIYGQVGIGKTIVAQQIAYFTFTRNTFCDGVYYFSLKDLPNHNYDLRNLMSSLLGLQFSQDVCEYFQNQKKMLLIFDDFDIIINSFNPSNDYKIKFFEYLFFYINKFDIHYILVTQKSLRPTLEQKNCPLSCIKSNMHYHEIKLFSRKESLNFLDSLLDLEQINIKKVLENRKQFEKIYKKAQGNPKKLIEQYCKKFGNPKIPKQFYSSIQQPNMMLQTQSTLNISPFTQQISNIPGAHNTVYQTRKKPMITNQKSREFISNHPTQIQVPPLNMMQVNQHNTNFSSSLISTSHPNSARQNYITNYSGEQNQYYNQFQMESSLPNSQVFNQEHQFYSTKNQQQQKSQTQLHSNYYHYNKLNQNTSQSMIIGNNMESSNTSILYNQQPSQIVNQYAEKKQSSLTSHQAHQNNKQNLLKITSSGLMKNHDYSKLKNSRNLLSQSSLHDYHSQHHTQFQHSNSGYVTNQQFPHNPQIHHSSFSGSSHQHHMSHPNMSKNMIQEINSSSSTGNTPQMVPTNIQNIALFQQFGNSSQHKKSFAHSSAHQAQLNSKNEQQKSSSKDARIHSLSRRNKVENSQIIVQSDPEVNKTSYSNEAINFQVPKDQANSDTSYYHKNSDYNQFGQEDIFQNQDYQLELGQDEYEERMHKREPSGNHISARNQYQSQQSNGSFVNLTQDNLQNSQSNLNNSIMLGSNNNGTSNRKLKKSQKKSVKYQDKHIQEEIQQCLSLDDEDYDDEEFSNNQYTDKTQERDLEKLEGSDFLKELFGQSKTEIQGESLSNSQSQSVRQTKNSSSAQNLKTSLYSNEQNYSSNGIPFEYQVNNIEEEDETKSDDEFINQLEMQKEQEINQTKQKKKDEEIITEETKEYIQSSLAIQSEVPQIQKDMSFELSKGGNFANLQDMVSSTNTEKCRLDDSLSQELKSGRSSSKQKSKKSTQIHHEFVEEEYLPQKVQDEEKEQHSNHGTHRNHHHHNHNHHNQHGHHQSHVNKNQKFQVDESEKLSSEEDGYQEEDEEGELNEDDDIDEMQSKYQYTQNIFFDKNELRVQDDDIDDKPSLKSQPNRENNQHRTPDKSLIILPYQQISHQGSLNSPPIIPISPSQNILHQYSHHLHHHQSIPHHLPTTFIQQSYTSTPQNHPHAQSPNSYPYSQHKKQNKPSLKEAYTERQNHQQVNISMISNISSQRGTFDFTDQISSVKQKSNQSLPSFLQIQKSDSQSSKATIQSAGSQNDRQNMKMISQMQLNNNNFSDQIHKKQNNKKKVNQTGKQAQIFNKKKKNKYNEYKNNNNQANKSSSNQEDDEDD